jgi:hypothetical protein
MISFLLVAAVNPILEMGGQIAAIVICLFTFILAVISLVLHLALAFSLTWVRQKAELIKQPRPKLENVNKVTEAALQGVEPAADENTIVRVVADVPVRVHAVEQKVDQVSSRAAGAVIELRARTVQARTIVKAFLAPGSLRREQLPVADKEGLEFKSPGYRSLMEKNAPEIPVAPEGGEDHTQAVTATQLSDVPSH